MEVRPDLGGWGGRSCAACCGLFGSVMRALQLQQMMAGGQQRPGASSFAYTARLVRLALMGILVAYLYIWIQKNI